jgi:hypothetical protein
MASLVGEAGVQAVGGEGPTPAELDEQLDRVLNSDVLKASHNLHTLLRFIVTATIEGRAESLKETTIATEVFGRRDDFDNRVDTVVRVQAHRLRRKLSKYYSGPGKGDPWIIEILPGSYVPQFLRRQAVENGLAPVLERKQETKRPALPVAAWVGLGLLVGLGLGFLAFGGGNPLFSRAVQISAAAPTPNVRLLWEPFLREGAPPTTVVFWNPLFLSNDKLLLRYSGPLTAPTGTGVISPQDLHRYVNVDIPESVGPVIFNWTYASIGQVYQTQALTALFWGSSRTFQMRPGRHFTAGDGENRNLVLGNIQGLDILNRKLEHFQMRAGEYGYKSQNQPLILNLRPESGEAAQYTMEFNEATQERRADHALLAWLPGRRPDLRIVVCDGLTAVASWAGMDLLTSEEGVEQLEKHLGSPLPPFFEAVVRAEIAQDQVAGFSVVAARAR